MTDRRQRSFTGIFSLCHSVLVRAMFTCSCSYAERAKRVTLCQCCSTNLTAAMDEFRMILVTYTLDDALNSIAHNGRLDGHPACAAVQTAILCPTFLRVTQGNQSMRNSSILTIFPSLFSPFSLVLRNFLLTRSEHDFGDRGEDR